MDVGPEVREDKWEGEGGAHLLLLGLASRDEAACTGPGKFLTIMLGKEQQVLSSV